MNFSPRAKSLAEVADRVLGGVDPGYEVKDFLHEFQELRDLSALQQEPVRLENQVPDGRRLDAFLQALAVYLAVSIDADPPSWTREAIRLAEPWFASAGPALRNYLLLSSPAPFRMRNLFLDQDSLHVV
jgi:hypothetical protein